MFCGTGRHGLGEAGQRNIEEFLDHLVAYDSAFSVDALFHEGHGSHELFGRIEIKVVNKDVRVQEELTFHSFLPE